MNIDFSKLRPIEGLKGEDEEETKQFLALHQYAKSFLSKFTWCSTIRNSFFGYGVADIVCIFLFEIEPENPTIDKFLWVIVGDIPPAYLVTDNTTDASHALEGYIEEMERWVNAVEKGMALNDIIPVNAEPTLENAKRLRSRLEFISREILPFIS